MLINGVFISDKLNSGRSKNEALRVLHIGNIANNAYLNAKILNRHKTDCDVICYDYYHIMGNPEWEDADFEDDYGDDFYPDWSGVDLKGFKRPDWFAQGKRHSCLNYLLAKRRGKRFIKWIWQQRLAFERLTAKYESGFIHSPLGRYISKVKRLGYRKLKGLIYKVFLPVSTLLIINCACWIAQNMPWMIWMINSVAVFGAVLFIGLRVKRITSAYPSESVEAEGGGLVQCFRKCFPDRCDQLTKDDYYGYASVLPAWRALLNEYDVIIGYATDGVYPLLAGKRPYLAYEHGTIRQIPFEETTQGRLCALTYRMADYSLITNCDNIEAAKRLGLKDFGFIPHPVNEDYRYEGKASELRDQLLKELDADFLVFHPSRQHWEDQRHPSWEKGNDIFIRGFARFYHEVAPRAAAVFVEWGQTVAASKGLLSELGITDRVKWIKPQPSRVMARYIQASDLLADQFYLGAFGSTMPKALMLGRAAMLYLDESRHAWCFPELPPILNARTPEEVHAGLFRLYQQPAFRRNLEAAGMAWYEKYHSNRVIAETIQKYISRVLSSEQTDLRCS